MNTFRNPAAQNFPYQVSSTVLYCTRMLVAAGVHGLTP
jgi:hypothetical protein